MRVQNVCLHKYHFSHASFLSIERTYFPLYSGIVNRRYIPLVLEGLTMLPRWWRTLGLFQLIVVLNAPVMLVKVCISLIHLVEGSRAIAHIDLQERKNY